MKFDFLDNPSITLIKIIAIAFITVIYSFGGISLCMLSDKYILNVFYDKTEEASNKKSIMRHIGETIAIISVYGILAYIARNLLQQIPFPLDNMYGFKYSRVNELTTGTLVLWSLLTYSTVLNSKISIIRRRLTGLN